MPNKNHPKPGGLTSTSRCIFSIVERKKQVQGDLHLGFIDSHGNLEQHTQSRCLKCKKMKKKSSNQTREKYVNDYLENKFT